MAYNTNLDTMAYGYDCDKEQSGTQRNLRIQYIEQKDHDISLLTAEVKDLKYKLKS